MKTTVCVEGGYFTSAMSHAFFISSRNLSPVKYPSRCAPYSRKTRAFFAILGWTFLYASMQVTVVFVNEVGYHNSTALCFRQYCWLIFFPPHPSLTFIAVVYGLVVVQQNESLLVRHEFLVVRQDTVVGACESCGDLPFASSTFHDVPQHLSMLSMCSRSSISSISGTGGD